MRNNIVRSTLLVMAVWWIILTVYFIYSHHPWNPTSWPVINQGFHTIAPQFKRIAVAIGITIPLILLFIVATQRFRKLQLRAKSKHGFTTTLGIIPPGLGEPERTRGAEIGYDTRDILNTWVSRLQHEHSNHYSVYQGIIEILVANEDMPAAPASQGHAGLSLFEHSCNVARIMLEEASKHTYIPKQDSRGRVSYPLHDQSYQFDGDDPLIGLLGFAHDIGKVECFELSEDGELLERRLDHDRVSALMIARLEEMWSLPYQDRKDLIEACAHYHHPNHLPIPSSDRARALMEFLIICDNAASHKEGRDELGLPIQGDNDNGESADAELMETLIDMLDEPDRINGNNRQLRLGFKHGGQLFLSEESIRNALCTRMELPARVKNHKLADGRYSITVRLMDALDRAGVLYKEHDGHRYSSARAMWNVTFMISNPKNPDDRRPVDIKAMIVVNLINDFSHLARLGDSLGMPIRLLPLWGEKSALRNGHSEDQPVLTVIEGGLDSDQKVNLSDETADLHDEVDQDVAPENTKDAETKVQSDEQGKKSTFKRKINRHIYLITQAIEENKLNFKKISESTSNNTETYGVYLDDRAAEVIGFDGIQTLIDHQQEIRESHQIIVQESSKEPGLWVIQLNLGPN